MSAPSPVDAASGATTASGEPPAMRIRRRVGLVIVTSCAVVLSFSGLYDLAILCAFSPALAALVPVLADAGAALAADVWLDTTVAKPVRRYARRIALALISTSVLGNAAAHLLVFLAVAPPWWVVVLVGSLAPAVVAANLHLYALVRAGGGEVATAGDQLAAASAAATEELALAIAGGDASGPLVATPAAGAGDHQDHHQGPVVMVADEAAPLGVEWPQPPLWRPAGGSVAAGGGDVSVGGDSAGDRQDDDRGSAGDEPAKTPDVLAEARALAAAGAGRPTLTALGISDHQARQLIRDHRPNTSPASAGARRKAAR